MRKSKYAAVLFALLSAGAFAKTTVTVWVPWGGPDGDAIFNAAKEFNGTQDEIEVRPTMVAGAGLDGGGAGRFMTAVASGMPPDLILYWGNDTIAGLAKNNAIMPLDELMAKTGLNPSAFNAAAFGSIMYGGKVYGVPEMINARMLYINNDHAVAAGLDLQNPPKTLDELSAWSDKMTKREADGKILQMGFIPWLGQGKAEILTGYMGGSLWDAAAGKPAIRNDGTAVVADWFAGVLTKYGTNNVSRFTASFGKALQSSGSDPFVGGVVSMQINGGWHANFIRKYNPTMKYTVAPVPVAGNATYGSSFVDGNTWMIPRGAKAPEAAMKFVTWFSQPERSAKVAGAVFNVTPLREGLALQSTTDNAAMALSVRMASSSGNFGLPAVDPMLVIRRELESGFNKLTAGQIEPAPMLEAVAKSVDTAIAQGRF